MMIKIDPFGFSLFRNVRYKERSIENGLHIFVAKFQEQVMDLGSRCCFLDCVKFSLDTPVSRRPEFKHNVMKRMEDDHFRASATLKKHRHITQTKIIYSENRKEFAHILPSLK